MRNGKPSTYELLHQAWTLIETSKGYLDEWNHQHSKLMKQHMELVSRTRGRDSLRAFRSRPNTEPIVFVTPKF